MSPEFEQPDLPGRDHRRIEVPADVARRLERDFLDDAASAHPPDWDAGREMHPVLTARLEEFAQSYARSPVEHLLILDRCGNVVDRAVGNPESVGFIGSHRLRGAVAIHNHPEGTPPSVEDIEHLITFGFRLVKIVTPSAWVFDVARGGSDKSLHDFVFDFRWVDQQSWAVAEECLRKRGLRISDTERFSRRQHAALSEMARLGYLCYARRQWMSAPESNVKSE